MAALPAAVVLFVALPDTENTSDLGVTEIGGPFGGDVIGFAELYYRVKVQRALALLHQWHGWAPLLDETVSFYRMQLHAVRFRGTCYRAANWIYVGQTTGRVRMDREHKSNGHSVKDIYLYQLIRNARQYFFLDLY